MSEVAEEEISAASMDEEESNPSEVIESETPPIDQPMESMENNFETNENDENQENLDGDEEVNGEDMEEEEEEREKVDFGDSDETDDDELVVTIGDIKTNLPPQRRGFPVQKLDPNVTPNVQGKNIFDVNPTEYDDRPWLKSGANIADYFNFGFTEETWNEYAEKQRLLRLEYPSQAEVNRVIMDELREKHGNKDVGVPIVMPVHNSGGRNLVTVTQTIDSSKPPVKVGFPSNPINTIAAENLPPMIRNLVASVSNTSVQSVQIPTVNLSAPTTVNNTPLKSPTKPMVVDLTKPPPNFNMPPPSFNAPTSGTDSPNPDIKPELPPGTIPTTVAPMNFNPNVPPPNFPMRLPSTNLTNFVRPPLNFQRPPMGNFYNHTGMMGGALNLNTPPPSMHRQQSHEGPPGVGGSRSSMDGPPGTEIDSYRSNRRDRERRRDSDGSDDDRRRRRYEKEREREPSSRTRRRSRSRSPRDRSSHRDKERDERKRRSSRDKDDRESRSSRRHKDDDRESSRRHRRDRDDTRQKSSTTNDLEEGPPGV